MSHRVVIVGAGAAGVFTAYRLREMYGDAYDIQLLESSGRIGGNTYATELEYGGQTYSIDCGAQFFYKNAQASYVELLEQLGLFDVDDDREIISAPAGITIWDRPANEHRFFVPARLGGLLHYDAEDWERLIEFGTYLGYGFALDHDGDWTTSVDDWLASLHLLSDEFKDNVVRPFLYQFVTLPPDRIGEASARYAVTYFVRNVFGEPRVDEPDPDPPSLPGLPVFETYQSLIGLDGILERVLAAVSVEATLNSPVQSVKLLGGRLKVQTPAGPIDADHVVLACDPNTSANILAAGGTAPAGLVAALQALEYAALPISMQKDASCYMPGDQSYWQAVNTIVDGNHAIFSAWFGPLRAKYDGNKQIPVFKSWGSPGLQPAVCPHEFLAHEHRILQPTTTFMAERAKLPQWQGQNGVWLAGGWLDWFDSQEAALDSATRVAHAMPGQPLPHSGFDNMIASSHKRIKRNLQRWLDRMARHAPGEVQARLARAFDEVESSG
jgi:predicted NAD/FAD-binding protein